MPVLIGNKLRAESLDFVHKALALCDLDIGQFIVINDDEIVHFNPADLFKIQSTVPAQIYSYAKIEKHNVHEAYTSQGFPDRALKISTPADYYDGLFAQKIWILEGQHKNLRRFSHLKGREYALIGKAEMDEILLDLNFNLIPLPKFQYLFPIGNGLPWLFLDRDGVINVDKSYVYKKEDCEFMPGIEDFLLTALGKGFRLAILTNQSGIGRGMYTMEQAFELNIWMAKHFLSKGIQVSFFELAPFHHEGVGEFKFASHLRKPWPGMALKVGRVAPIDLHRSLMIGDKPSDKLWLPLLDTIFLKGAYDLKSVDEKKIFKNLKEAQTYLEFLNP